MKTFVFNVTMHLDSGGHERQTFLCCELFFFTQRIQHLIQDEGIFCPFSSHSFSQKQSLLQTSLLSSLLYYVINIYLNNIIIFRLILQYSISGHAIQHRNNLSFLFNNKNFPSSTIIFRLILRIYGIFINHVI